MATKRTIAPTRAWAQGELAALSLAGQTGRAVDDAGQVGRARIGTLSADLQRLVGQRRSQEFARNVAARELAAINARRAELVPRHAKMQLQAEGLRRAQLATSNLDQQRLYRRERAELGVRVEDLARLLAQLEQGASNLRGNIVAAEKAIAAGEHAAFVARAALADAQRDAPPLAHYLQPLARQLAIGSCQFYLAAPGPERSQAMLAGRQQVADALLALCSDMAAGRFGEQEVSSFAGGRDPLLAECCWGLLALGDDARLAAVYDAMMPAPFSHQIFAVFRAFLPALLRREPGEALALALGAHRFAQGLRGALAEAAYCLALGDEEGFGLAVKQVPAYDWRQGHGPGQAAFGLVSVASAGLARLGAERGWRLPGKELNALAPADLWRPRS